MKKLLDVVRRFVSKWLMAERHAEAAPVERIAAPSRASPLPSNIIKVSSPDKPTWITRRQCKLSVLECIDKAFYSVSGRVYSGGWVHADTQRAIYKMGPWCPYSALIRRGTMSEFYKSREHWENRDKRKIESPDNFPGIFVIDHNWIGGEEEVPDDQIPLCLSYAMRLKTLPWDVEGAYGVGRHGFDDWVYYEHGRKYHGHTSKKKETHWINAYLKIHKETGEVRALNQLVMQPVKIRLRNKRAAQAYYRCYNKKVWVEPLSNSAPPDYWGETPQGRINTLIEEFVQDFTWWRFRGERWSASVKRDNRRVTFSVDQQDTKYFFKDRDATALTPSGQRKKIIHYVRGHTRMVNGRERQVREHIRGLREFTWNGYDVHVTAPQFHAFSVDRFTIAGEVQEGDESTEGMLTMAQVASKIASLEDDGQAKSKAA